MSFDIKNIISTHVKTSWKNPLEILIKPYEPVINEILCKDIELYGILPPKHLIFNAFNHFNMNELRVVIIGQDVYQNKGLGDGLCFSVSNPESKIPPSLKNIFKELSNEYDATRQKMDLTDWANQGVLMLNSALTVRENVAGSHLKVWKNFTEDVVQYITKNYSNIVYILWGNHAIGYKKFIDEDENCILTWTHPSPLSRKPFVGNNHFKLCNEYLHKSRKDRIKWI